MPHEEDVVMGKTKLLSLSGALMMVVPFALPQAVEAQGYFWGRGNANVNLQQRSIYNRLQMGRRSGALNAREYDRLLREYRAINRQEARFRSGGLSWQERRALDRRLDSLNRRLQSEMWDRQTAGRYWRWF